MTDPDDPRVWLASLAALSGFTSPRPWTTDEEVDGVYAGQQTVVRAADGPRVVSIGQARRHDAGRAALNVAVIAETHNHLPELLALAAEALEARQQVAVTGWTKDDIAEQILAAAAAVTTDDATPDTAAPTSADNETPPAHEGHPDGGQTCKCPGRDHDEHSQSTQATCRCGGRPGSWCTDEHCANNPIPAVPLPYSPSPSTVEHGGVQCPNPHAATVLDAEQTRALRAVLGVLASMGAQPDGYDAAEMLRWFPWHNTSPDKTVRVTLVPGSHVLNARDARHVQALLRRFMTDGKDPDTVAEATRFLSRQGW